MKHEPELPPMLSIAYLPNPGCETRIRIASNAKHRVFIQPGLAEKLALVIACVFARSFKTVLKYFITRALHEPR